MTGGTDPGGGRITMFWSSRSPFVRKAMICAHVCGLADGLDLVRVQVGSLAISDALRPVSPLNRIPALRLADGTSVFGSGPICRFFAQVSGMDDLVPLPGDPRYLPALLLEEAGDTIMDFTTARMAERGRPTPDPERLEMSARKIRSGADWLERQIPAADPGRPDLGQIALLAALGHLDFRDAALDWRHGRPKLSAWFAAASGHPGFAATAHELIY